MIANDRLTSRNFSDQIGKYVGGGGQSSCASEAVSDCQAHRWGEVKPIYHMPMLIILVYYVDAAVHHSQV